jgi:hypothetical protein
VVSAVLAVPGCGEDFGAHIAAPFSPFVVLPGQDRAVNTDDGVAGGEGKDTPVLRRISLFSCSWGLLDQICRQISRGKAVNARMSSRASSRWAAAAENLAYRARRHAQHETVRTEQAPHPLQST